MLFFDDSLRDLRFALRALARSPGFAAVAILSIALGIGANAAIFSVLDALMLRPLPVDQPQSLVAFVRTIQGFGTATAWPYPAYVDFRALDLLISTAASASTQRVSVRVDHHDAQSAGPVDVGLVSGNYFSTLGVRAALGRTLTTDDDRAQLGAPAVISQAYWAREFSNSPDVLGRVLTLGNATATIVGVAGGGFEGENVGDRTDVWVPIEQQADVMPEQPGLMSNTRAGWVQVLARLKPGATREAVEAAARATFKPAVAGWRANQRLDVVPIGTGFSRGREFLETPLTILLAIVGVVLLIACANVAALLIARSHARRRELAVRLAIGASRGRLIRHLLAECVVISVAAGVLGLGIGALGARALTALTNAGRMQLSLDVRVDARMLVVTFGASLLTGLIFGLAPAWSSTRLSLTSALRGAASPGGTRFRSGKVLVVVQIAMTLVLALGAGLLVKTLSNLETQNLGFDRDHVWMFFMETLQSGKRQAALVPVLAAADQRVAAIPGVLSSAVSSDGVLSGFVGRRAVTVPGRTPSANEDVNAEWNLVGPRFFHTLGIQLIKGRDFGPADIETSPHVAVVNESMARYFFGSTDPIGQRFYFGQELSAPVEIVGVVGNSKYFDARDDDVRMVYMPYRQDANYLYRLCIVVRTANDDPALLQRIRAELKQVDPAIPVGRVTSTAEQLDSTLSGERMMAWLVGLFGVLAIALACIGLYGVMAGTAARRTREIGIRIAIGASRGSVLGAVIGEAFWLTAAGIAIGVPCAFAAAKSVQSQLYGVTATDPLTLTAAIILLVIVTIAAAFLPAYRASRVNPVVALRTE